MLNHKQLQHELQRILSGLPTNSKRRKPLVVVLPPAVGAGVAGYIRIVTATSAPVVKRVVDSTGAPLALLRRTRLKWMRTLRRSELT